jgi:hypothetical protein
MFLDDLHGAHPGIAQEACPGAPAVIPSFQIPEQADDEQVGEKVRFVAYAAAAGIPDHDLTKV